jgi:photosystem II stability/assembly factor-like uncharacterized protein
MKKLLLSFSLLIALTMQAQDYWTEYATNQPTASTGMRSISIVDNNVTWLSMSCGTTGCATIRRYAKTTDGGFTWSSADIDLGAAATNLEIANICGISADVAYASVFPKATGVTGGVWQTVNGGTTWTRQATASFNGADGASFTNLVHFWDANNGVTMGDPSGGSFEIYTTTNGGTNWTRVPSGNIPAAIDVQEYGLTNQYSVTGNTIWIGTTFGRTLISTDRGYNWTVVQTPIADFGGGINGSESGDLSFTDASNGLLQTSDYLLYSTNDGGNTWSDVLWSGVLRNFGISEIPGLANTYVSIGEDLDLTERGSSYSTDSGLTWTSINDNPDINYVDGGVIAFLNPTMGFASGFSTTATVGGIFKWNGNSLANPIFSNDKGFSAFINASTGTLEVTGKNITSVTVYDVLGKQVFNGNYSSVDAASINAGNFNSGIYLVQVTNNAGAASTVKVVKN